MSGLTLSQPGILCFKTKEDLGGGGGHTPPGKTLLPFSDSIQVKFSESLDCFD